MFAVQMVNLEVTTAGCDVRSVDGESRGDDGSATSAEVELVAVTGDEATRIRDRLQRRWADRLY